MNKEIIYAPSVLSGNFSRAGEDLRLISDAGCDYVHLDVMDGSFVPNITFGHKFIEDLRKDSDLIFDVHLMIEEPERHIPNFIKAGSDIITVHQEATRHLHRCLSMIKEADVECGVAINPGTSISSIETVLSMVDFVLVMSVNPGFGGQKFIPESIRKISELDMLRRDEGYSYRIAVDGGIAPKTIKSVVDAGANLTVMGSAFFGASDPRAFIQELDSILEVL